MSSIGKLALIKSNHNQQQFSQRKLAMSLQRSLLAAGQPLGGSRVLAKEATLAVSKKLSSLKSKQITTNQLRTLAAHHLAKTDRQASYIYLHYKQL